MRQRDPWIRIYKTIQTDPKHLQLSDRDFRLWIYMAGAANEETGELPESMVLAKLLGVRNDTLNRVVTHMLSLRLLDEVGNDNVTFLKMHNWGERQYKSDSSTERVAKYRSARKGVSNVSETLHVTPPRYRFRFI